jgi:glycerol-3-phosphate dehydrogenase (NAD(P)+)
MKVSVLGDGAWGSAIADMLSDNSHEVKLWGPFPDYIKVMKETRKNPRFLPQLTFNEKIEFTSKIEQSFKNAEVIILALPSQYQRKLLQDIKEYVKKEEQIFVNIAKGIENNTLERMSQVAEEILGPVKYAVLSGPSHAEEVARAVPTAVVLGCKDQKVGELLQQLFINKFFRVYLTDDYIGVELGGALKNVFAIAAGIADGMNLGDNSKAALVTRSIAEMSRLGKTLGGKYETFSGLSGIGDMLVTCYSRHSRNRFVGEGLGKNKTLDQVLQELGLKVAEGIKTTKSAYELSKKMYIETPIIDELYFTLYENKHPFQCMKDLMNRAAKPEIY